MPKRRNNKNNSRIEIPQKELVKEKVSAIFFLPRETISSSSFQIIKSELSKASTNSQIYLVVRCSGGDAYSAVRIIRHIRTKYKTIIGVIPDYTYSAATLIMLGVHNIYVSSEGYIAPIDKPIEHTPTGEPISALDITQSLPSLASLVSEQARSFYDDLRGKDFPDYISKKEALAISWNTAVKLVEPLIVKIDPVLLQKSYRDLRIGMYYGIDLLRTGMLKNNLNRCLDIVRQLVNIYPSHGYAIFREEMKNLGLVVDDLEKCKDEGKLLDLYSKISFGIKYYDNIYA